jgi:hypothetical protein
MILCTFRFRDSMSFYPGKIFNSVPGNGARNVSVRSHSWIACRSRAQRPSVLCHDLFMKGDQMEITALGGITLTQGLSLVHKDRGGLES